MLRWLDKVLGRTEPTQCAQAVLLLEENWHYKPVLELQHESGPSQVQRSWSSSHPRTTGGHQRALRSTQSAGPPLHRKLSHDQLTYLAASSGHASGSNGVATDLDSGLYVAKHELEHYLHPYSEPNVSSAAFEPAGMTLAPPAAQQSTAGAGLSGAPVPTLRSALPKSQMGSMIFNMSMSATTLGVLDADLSLKRDGMLHLGPTPAKTIVRQNTTEMQRPKNSLPIDELISMLRHQARKRGSPAATTPKQQDVPLQHAQTAARPIDSTGQEAASAGAAAYFTAGQVSASGPAAAPSAVAPSSDSSCKELSFVGVYGARSAREASPTPSVPLRIVGFEVKPQPVAAAAGHS